MNDKHVYRGGNVSTNNKRVGPHTGLGSRRRHVFGRGRSGALYRTRKEVLSFHARGVGLNGAHTTRVLCTVVVLTRRLAAATSTRKG